MAPDRSPCCSHLPPRRVAARLDVARPLGDAFLSVFAVAFHSRHPNPTTAATSHLPQSHESRPQHASHLRQVPLTALESAILADSELRKSVEEFSKSKRKFRETLRSTYGRLQARSRSDVLGGWSRSGGGNARVSCSVACSLLPISRTRRCRCSAVISKAPLPSWMTPLTTSIEAAVIGWRLGLEKRGEGQNTIQLRRLAASSRG